MTWGLWHGDGDVGAGDMTDVADVAGTAAVADRVGGGASPAAIRHHYDIDAQFYGLWLDELMTYSAARWPGQADLAGAQRAKLDFFLDRTRAVDGPLLEIGCGWGSFLARAAEVGDLRPAVALTLSPAQADVVRARVGDRAEVRVESWEDHTPARPYGSVVSIAAFEHFARPGLGTAGRIARYRELFAKVHSLLAPGGRFGLQTIAFDQAEEEDRGPLTDFFQTVLFPESILPRVPDLVLASEPWFHLVSLECSADDYVRTAHEWRTRLLARRDEAEALVGPEVVERYLRYLIAGRVAFRRGDWTLTRSIFVARRTPRAV